MAGRTIHAPELHLAIIGSRYHQWQCGVKARPVYTAVVAFENILDNRIGSPKKVRIHPRDHVVGRRIKVWCPTDVFLAKVCKHGNELITDVGEGQK